MTASENRRRAATTPGRPGRSGRSFQLGRNVTVSVPEAVAEQVSAVFAETFGRRAREDRPRPAPQRLSADRIVEVAIEQMRERGYDAVTMRSIARALGTGPASLYAHVANRAELDQLVVDRISSRWEIPDPDPQRWDEQLTEALHGLLALLQAHPGVARCTLGMIPTSAGTLVPMERMLALLRAGGVPEQDAAWFVDVATLHVASVVVEEDIWRSHGDDAALNPEELTEEHVVGKVRELFSALPREHFPTIRSMAVALTTGSGRDRFDFGVDLLVGGLRLRAERASQR